MNEKTDQTGSSAACSVLPCAPGRYDGNRCQDRAWISVYSEKDGWLDNVIYFDGKDWNLMDPTFASSSNSSDSVMKFIGDGKNYKQKYAY